VDRRLQETVRLACQLNPLFVLVFVLVGRHLHEVILSGFSILSCKKLLVRLHRKAHHFESVLQKLRFSLVQPGLDHTLLMMPLASY
jgi:hypothetical protein